MKNNVVIAITLMLISVGCATPQSSPTISHADGSPAVVASGLTLGSPLHPQSSFDRFTIHNGDLKIGYHFGNDLEMGMRSLRVLNGDLNLELDFYTTHLFFPRLEKVTGNIVITCSSFGGMDPVNVLAMLDFKSLKDVGGNIVFRGIPPWKNWKTPGLTKGYEVAAFPSLMKVGGNIQFDHTGAYTGIEMPLLESIGGGFSISSSPRMTYVNLNRLKTIGDDMTISNNEVLARIDLSSLKKAAAIELTDNNFISNQPVDVKVGKRFKGTININ